jgi:hypothetical protein
MHTPNGLSAADFMALFNGTTPAGIADRLAAYDRAIARLDGEIAIAEQAPSLESALATLSPDSKETP